MIAMQTTCNRGNTGRDVKPGRTRSVKTVRQTHYLQKSMQTNFGYNIGSQRVTQKLSQPTGCRNLRYPVFLLILTPKSTYTS